MSRTAFPILLFLFSILHVQAQDLGFRYRDQKCLNAMGEAGLNPNYIGQCGYFENRVIVDVEWQSLDLRGTVFRQTFFLGVFIDDSDLSGVQIIDSKISASTLSNSSLHRLQIINSEIEESELAFLEGIHILLDRSKFVKSTLDSIIWPHLIAKDLIADQLKIQFSDFVSSQWSESTVIDSRLREVSLIKSTWRNSDFFGSTLAKIKLNEVTFAGLQFGDSIWLNSEMDQVHFQGSSYALDVSALGLAKIPPQIKNWDIEPSISGSPRQLCMKSRWWTLGKVKTRLNCRGGAGALAHQVIQPLKRPSDIQSRNNSNCAIENNRIICWGGQIPRLPLADLIRPVAVDFSNSFVCGINSGIAKCSGREESVIKNIPSLEEPRQISAGFRHACALDKNGVHCWGVPSYGHLKVPTLKSPSMISTSLYYSCAIDDQTLRCWGGEGIPPRLQISVPKELTKVSDVSVGPNSICALVDQDVQCWGSEVDLVGLPPSISKPKKLHLSWLFGCVQSDQELKCWSNYRSKKFDYNFVVPIKPDTKVSAGHGHLCTLTDDQIKCYGDHSAGQLEPVKKAVNYDRIAVGQNHSCSIFEDSLHCWGANGFGQSDTRSVKGFDQIHLGPNRTCVSNASQVQCWGSDAAGFFKRPKFVKPRKILLNFSDFLAIDDDKIVHWGISSVLKKDIPMFKSVQDIGIGNRFACALGDREVKCWGNHQYGGHLPPMDMADPMMLAVAPELACALDRDNLRCWGLTGTNLNQRTTESFKDDKIMQIVAVGYSNVCALHESLNISCRGQNSVFKEGDLPSRRDFIRDL